MGELRWLMRTNTGPFPRFLLVMLVSWLIALFVSFGIFAPRNPLVLAGLCVRCAVCGAISLILAMYHPTGLLIRMLWMPPLKAAMEQPGR